MIRFFYTLITIILLPLGVVRLYWKSLKNSGYRKRLRERFGLTRIAAEQASIWIHAVSVGEVQAAEPLIRWLLSEYQNYSVVITTTTPTGSERVLRLFGDSVLHSYMPYDLPLFINNFIKRTNPVALVLIETEIWPNLLTISNKNNITSILANARLSQRSARRYARLASFSKDIFSKIDYIACQTRADGERFTRLGVDRQQITVTGSIKYDIKLSASLSAQAEVLVRGWGHRSVWVAASTHDGEEKQLLDAHKSVLKLYPQALLVLVPRHPERFTDVFQMVKDREFSVVKRSTGDICTIDQQVLLGDTMGELMIFFAAADIAFVGGSLIPRGGHNILEPAALGLPVIFGPHMFNFVDIKRQFIKSKAAAQISNSDELSEVICRWFGNAEERTKVGERGLQIVESNRGALERLKLIITKGIYEKVKAG